MSKQKRCHPELNSGSAGEGALFLESNKLEHQTLQVLGQARNGGDNNRL